MTKHIVFGDYLGIRISFIDPRTLMEFMTIVIRFPKGGNNDTFYN